MFCNYKEKRFLLQMWPKEAKVGREARMGSGKQEPAWVRCPEGGWALENTDVASLHGFR